MRFNALSLLSSFGLKRKLAALLQTVVAIVGGVPALAPYVGIVGSVAAWLGIGGIVQAGASKTLKLVPLSTIAAFFGALLTAAKNVPELQPYEGILHSIVVILSLFATGSIVGGGKG